MLSNHRTGLSAVALAALLASAPASAVEFAVVSGGSVEIGHALEVDPHCVSLGRSQISLLQQLRGGTLEVRYGRAFPNFSALNTHSSCNSRRVPAALIIYRSTAGYHGSDEVSYEIVFPHGRVKRRTVTISVR